VSCEKSHKMKSRAVGIITVLGLILAAIGIVAPIVWDLYKSHTALQIRLISSSRLVGGGPTIDKLQFSYDGRPVAALSKLSFVLANSGRTPIRSGDIVTPPTVTLPDARVLDTHIDNVKPSNLASSTTTNSSGHSVAIAFPLLNPSDQIQFSLLVEADRPQVDVSARIAGLTALEFIDQSGVATTTRRKIPATVWIVGVFTAFCLLCVFAGIQGVGQESVIKQIVRSDLSLLPTGLKPAEYRTLILRAFPSHKKSDMKAIENHLTSLPPEEAVAGDNLNQLRSLLRETFPSDAMIFATGFFAVLSAIGIGYTVSSLW
jgi:hypothetical protein